MIPTFFFFIYRNWGVSGQRLRTTRMQCVMFMKRIFSLLLATILVGQVLALGGPQKMASMMSQVQYEVSPRVLEARNGNVEVEITFTFPPKFFYSGVKVEITPVLKYIGKEKSFESCTIQGEGVRGYGQICSFANGGTFRTKSSIRFEEMMRSSELFVRAKIITGNNEIVCSDVKVADGVIAPTGTYTTPEDYFAGIEWMFVNKHRAALPKKAQPKKIDYPNGYSVECYLLNNELADNLPVSITDNSNGKVIFEGCAIDNHNKFVGTWKKDENEAVCGAFAITNNSNGTFSLKTKGTTKPTFSIKEMNSYITKCGNNSLLVDFSKSDITGKYKLFIWGIDGKKSWFEATIDKATAEQLYKDVRKSFSNGIKGKVTAENEGYTFDGSVAFNDKSGKFEEREGKRIYTKGKYRKIEILNEVSTHRVEISFASGNEISQASIVYKDIDFYKIQWWSIDDYINNANEIELLYPSGDSFKGIASYVNGKIKPESGIYTYRNGDKFTGSVVNKAVGDIFVDGTTTFVDGYQSVNGNWLSKYQLTGTQLSEIMNKSNPTEKRKYAEKEQKENKDRAEKKQKEEVFFNYINNGDKAFDAKKYEDAKRWYTLAINSIPDGMNMQYDLLKDRLRLIDEAPIRTESIRKGNNKYVVEYTRIGYRLIGFDDKDRKKFEYENRNKGTINLKTWNMKIPNRGKLVRFEYDSRGVLDSRKYYNESQSYYMKEEQTDDGSFRCRGIYENSGEFMDDILIDAHRDFDYGFFGSVHYYYDMYRNDPKTGMKSKITTVSDDEAKEWLLDYLYKLDR